MLVETEKLHTKKPDILQAALKLFKDILIQLIEEGKESGVCREMEGPLAGALLVGMILRVTQFKREGHLAARLTDLTDEVAAACWRVVGKEEGGSLDTYPAGGRKR